MAPSRLQNQKRKMGLINWIRGKEIAAMKANLDILRAEVEATNIRMDALKSSIASVRSSINQKKRKKDDEEPDDEESYSIPPEARKFYEQTIEFQQAQKYKNLENNE